MKKMLSVLLSFLLVFNAAFTTTFARTDDNSQETPVGTTVIGDITVEDMDSSDVKSPIMNVATDKIVESSVKYEDDDVVRVSIVLKDPATLDKYATEQLSTRRAISYRQNLADKQETVVEKIEKKLDTDLDVVWNLTLAANIVSVNVRYADLEAIASLKDVQEIWVENQYEAEDDVNTSLTTEGMTFAQYCWANGYTGAGQLIAIIDTGTNQDHISFSGDALAYSLTKDGQSLDDYDLLTKEDIAAVADQLNVSIDVDLVYESLKIPYAYNYIDENYYTDHLHDAQGEHGSHVSGIAAANRYVEVEGEFVDALDSVCAVGVAPDAQIITMKVFGSGGGAYDSDYMAAIEDAIVLRADAANLSLGSGNSGWAFSAGYQDIMDSLAENSTVISFSAGNSYSWSYYATNEAGGGYLYADDVHFATTGTPGSFNNSLSVASADNIGVTGTPLVFGDLKVFYTESEGYNNTPFANHAGEYEFVYVDTAGNESDFAAVDAVIDLEGKIVICNRGSISFYVKGNNAGAYNPAGIVIANNAAGTINMNLEGYTYTYPCVAISLADANAIKASATKTTVDGIDVYTGSATVTNVLNSQQQIDRSEAVISEFSSWGGLGSLTMKPEITAPGGNIYSVNGMHNDTYELMSGTSMAAPHVAGMAAVLTQYIEENNLTEYGTTRQLINSLLMSTATPMFDEYGCYYPILQQGSGLADVLAASESLSFITMNQDATASYADGKVKAELGDDPDRTGKFEYSFNVTNFSDTDLEYVLSTDLFTQDLASDGTKLYLAPYTTDLYADVTYTFDSVASHDVDLDGDTDTDDAQALLDYLTGAVDGSTLDLAAGEMDGAEGISSYDAELLLQWQQVEAFLVPAGETKTVKVTIQLLYTDEMDELWTNGAYVEGYTYLDCITTTTDGAVLDVEKSIPLLGYYGSWTDPDMYDTTVKEQLYDGETSYFGQNSGYMAITYPGDNTAYVFTGNPYVLEASYPYDRLAINSNTTVEGFAYVLTRNAGTVGSYVTKADADGTLTETLASSGAKQNVYAAYYYVNGGAWNNTSPQTSVLGKTMGSLGLVEGDKADIALYAVPEYYAMDSKGVLTDAKLAELVKASTFGDGAKIGGLFTVDDTAPTIESVELIEGGTTLTVKVKDNQYVAAIGLMDITGEEVYALEGVDQTTAGESVTVTLDIAGLDLGNACCLFVGDYAANETYKVVKFADGPITVNRHYYKLTDTFVDGNEYIIVNTNAAGDAIIAEATRLGSYVEENTGVVTVSEELGTIVTNEYVNDAMVWVASAKDDGTFTLENKQYGGYLHSTGTFIKDMNDASCSWSVAENNLQITTTSSINGYLLMYYPTYEDFILRSSSTVSGTSYVYEHRTYTEEVDVTVATEVVVTPETSTVIVGANDTVQLSANVKPVYLDNRTVTWSSSDETIATVDENGLVTGLKAGTVTITATSVQTPSVSGTATVEVLEASPMDATLFAEVTVGSDVQFAVVDLNDMSFVAAGHGNEDYPFVGGGRDADNIVGSDVDGDVYMFDIANDFAGTHMFTIAAAYQPVDGANFPATPVTVDDTSSITVDYDLAGVTTGGRFAFYDMVNAKVSSFTITAYMQPAVALCFGGIATDQTTGAYSLYYYLLSADSTMWLWIVTPKSDGSLGARLGQIGTLDGFTVGEDLTAYSMTYAREQTGQNAVLLTDNTTKGVWYLTLPTDENDETIDCTFVGSVACNNIGTTFNNVFDSADLTSSTVTEETVALADAKCNVALTSEVASIAEAETTGGVNSVMGSTAISRVLTPVNAKAVLTAGVSVDDEDAFEIIYTQDEDCTNGLFTLTYDPEKTTLVSVETDLEFSSYTDVDGTVTFAFASVDTITAGEEIAKFTFTSCEDTEVTVVTKEVNDQLGLSEEVTETVVGHGHDWSFDKFVWSEDHRSAVAQFVCTYDEEHVLEVEADVKITVITEPDYENEGLAVAKATVVFNQEEYTDEVEFTLPMLVPTTGDNSHIQLWTAVSAVSLLAIVALLFARKKATR